MTSPARRIAQAEAPQWKPADIVAAVRATPMTVADYADVLLAIRESIPDLNPPDKSLATKIRWAARLSPRFVQSMATGLETSALWQKSADATPEELTRNLERESELRPLAEQANALNALLQFNTAYHHFVAVDKARVAYGVGARLGGNEGKAITPHLKIAKESLPKTRHKSTKTLLSEIEAPAQTK